MGWLIAAAAAAALLLLPLVVSVHLYFDAAQKKLFFGVYILRAVKLRGGYAAPAPRGAASAPRPHTNKTPPAAPPGRRNAPDNPNAA